MDASVARDGTAALARTRQPVAQTRQTREVRVFSLGYAHDRLLAPVHPGWDRLLCARSGAGIVRTSAGLAVLDRERAYRIGVDAAVEIEARTSLDLRIVYQRTEPLPSAALQMTALGSELIERVVTRGWLDAANRNDAHLIAVIAGELDALAVATRPVGLALPHSERALRAAMLCGRAEPIAGAELARLCGCSVRTLERSFVRETGLGLAAWQRRARLLAAASAIADGCTVTSAGLDAGYGGTSAFITAFRRAFGITPRQIATLAGR